jgi:ribosomal protein L11 methylase PrmA
VANLYADLLVRALPRMKRWRAPGGVMILSGVLRTQEAEVTAALARLHLRPARILRKGKWICFAGVHDE